MMRDVRKMLSRKITTLGFVVTVMFSTATSAAPPGSHPAEVEGEPYIELGSTSGSPDTHPILSYRQTTSGSCGQFSLQLEVQLSELASGDDRLSSTVTGFSVKNGRRITFNDRTIFNSLDGQSVFATWFDCKGDGVMAINMLVSSHEPGGLIEQRTWQFENGTPNFVLADTLGSMRMLTIVAPHENDGLPESGRGK